MQQIIFFGNVENSLPEVAEHVIVFGKSSALLTALELSEELRSTLALIYR
jgi:hypothetical protein